MQALYDAIKQARETGEAWVTWNKERLRIVPLVYTEHVGYTADGKSLEDCTNFEAFVKARTKGHVRIESLGAYKDVGSRLRSYSHDRRLGWKDVCAIITEGHKRNV